MNHSITKTGLVYGNIIPADKKLEIKDLKQQYYLLC